MQGDLNTAALRRNVILAFALVMSAVVLWMIRSLIEPLFLAAVFSALLHGTYRKLAGWIGRPWLASALMVVVLGLVAVVGGLLLAGLVARQAIDVIDLFSKKLEGFVPVLRLWLSVSNWIPTEIREWLPDPDVVAAKIDQARNQAEDLVTENLSAITSGLAAFALKSFVMLYAMFFFFRDGPQIIARVKRVVPLNPDQKDQVLSRFQSVTRAAIRGTLMIAAIQGALVGVAFWMAGLESPAFFGLLTMLMSVIPGIGTGLVWVPALLVLWFQGEWLTGTLFLLWCGGVVSTIDNVLRPYLVGQEAKMPDLMILVGTLGGIHLFGILGFVIGPVLCAMFLTAWNLYVVAFRTALGPVAGHSNSGSDDDPDNGEDPDDREDDGE